MSAPCPASTTEGRRVEFCGLERGHEGDHCNAAQPTVWWPQAGGEPGAQAGAQEPAQGPVDTFTRRRLSVDDLHERLRLPGGHRDRVVLVSTIWSEHRVLTPWRVYDVLDGTLVVRLATDPSQPTQHLRLAECRVYGLAEEGV